MTSRHDCDVAVCGAGIGGLALALALGRRGVSVQVLERTGSPPMPRRAENLQPNGLRVLDQLGLLQPLLAAGACRVEQFHFVSMEGEPLCTIDYRELPGAYPYTVITTPSVMQPLWVKALSGQPTVQFRWGTAVTAISSKPDGLRIAATDASGAPITVRARVVVGADGVHSTVRQAAGIRARVHWYRDGYATAIVSRPAGLNGGSRYAVGRGQILALFPVSASEAALLYLVRRDRWPAVQAEGLNALKARIIRAAPLTAEALAAVTSWDQVGFMPCARVRAARWTADRIALIGDAAHAMNPHVAQGRNQAMIDALVLAEVVADGLKRDDLSGVRLAQYEIARRSHVETLQRVADELTLFWNNDWWPVGWLRGRVFRTLARNRRLRGRMTAFVGGLPVAPYSWIERFQAAGVWPDPRADELVMIPES
ncbi:MAG: NAD(P)/FAD-dependent oxidoreductase [Nitrospirota bacterium]